MAYLYIVIAFILNSTANILLKSAAEEGLKLSNYNLILGLLCFAINVIFYFLALKTLPISVAYPVMIVASFLIINSFALFRLQEKINLYQILGYILIIAGIFLVLKFNQNS